MYPNVMALESANHGGLEIEGSKFRFLKIVIELNNTSWTNSRLQHGGTRLLWW